MNDKVSTVLYVSGGLLIGLSLGIELTKWYFKIPPTSPNRYRSRL